MISKREAAFRGDAEGADAPDVFSQTLLAVPMWLLFEAGSCVAA